MRQVLKDTVCPGSECLLGLQEVQLYRARLALPRGLGIKAGVISRSLLLSFRLEYYSIRGESADETHTFGNNVLNILRKHCLGLLKKHKKPPLTRSPGLPALL